jgi:cytochrome oxidase Cu insertion factor (SCO1/SenC/PrrC family)
MSTPAAIARRRGLLLLLALLFLTPLLLSFVIYYGFHWRPAGTTNHGVLITPARTLPQIALPQLASAGVDAAASGGEALAAANVLSGKWSLVYVGRGDCDADCRDTLYFMRQTYLGLGHLTARLQRVFLVTASCCDRDYLAREQPGLITLNAEGAAAAALLAQFPAERRAASIFVVDPRGNLMLRYDAHEDPRGLRNDLKKLLDLSHIG